MAHFSDETWADYVRGTATSETQTAIESHLASVCAECQSALEAWRQVTTFSKTEPAYTPPQDAVRYVKQQFALRHEPKPLLSSVLAKLIFDTFAQPLPVAIRGAVMTARQMVFEGEGFIVDLRFERQVQSSKTSIIGQVLRSGPIRGIAAGVPVLLVDQQTRPIDHMNTNDFGEFHFEFERHGLPNVAIQVDSTRMVLISLQDLQGREAPNLTDKDRY